jgi:acetate---CoA ligase (ADP-forming)
MKSKDFIIKDLSPLLNPRSIAVVGASEKEGAGSFVIENLETLGFTGKIIPVHPMYQRVFGREAYPSLLEIPEEERIDCVAILLGYRQVIPVLEQAGKRGIHGAWAFASGFAETGEEGATLQKELRKVCIDYGIHFCGPNCVGYANLQDQVGTYSAPISPTLKKGTVSIISQSGSVLLALANSNRGIGFNLLISSGNEAVLDVCDYIAYLLEDKKTEAIVTFIEAIRRPEAFIQCCERALELEKPIITLKVGRSQMAQRVTQTHTGALTGSNMIQEALFRKLGVISVEDLDQLLETAEALVRCRGRWPRGNRMGVITVSGGEISLIGDLSDGLSISFPSLSQGAEEELRRRLPSFTPIGNPLDGWGSGDLKETYSACLEVLAKEDGIDLIVVSQDSPPGMALKQVDQYVDVAKAAVHAAALGKPVIAFSHLSGGLDQTIKGILDRGNIPFLQGTRESLLAIQYLVRYGEHLRRRKEEEGGTFLPSHRNLNEIVQRLEGPRRVLPGRECKEILKAYGIAVARERIVRSVEEALDAAQDLSFPVVMKGQSAEIPHKTEAGLVQLNIDRPEGVRASFDQITGNAHRYRPGAHLEGILIQEMMPGDAVEVLLGISKDPSFGPVVAFGLGGIWVELLKDTTLRVPPIDPGEAWEMISEVRGRAILEGFRGSPKADVDSLVGTIVQMGRMAIDLKGVLISLDLNPLMVLPGKGGVRVVDVVMEAGN